MTKNELAVLKDLFLERGFGNIVSLTEDLVIFMKRHEYDYMYDYEGQGLPVVCSGCSVGIDEPHLSSCLVANFLHIFDEEWSRNEINRAHISASRSNHARRAARGKHGLFKKTYKSKVQKPIRQV